MNIFIDEQIPLLAESLKECGNVILFSGRNLCANDLISKLCQILFVRSTTKVDQNLLTGTYVQFVGTATSGIDHIDLEYLNSKGVRFAFAPGSNANSVAEYAIFSVLHWAFSLGIDLKNLKIGIIGYGNIGSLVGKYANFFGFKVFVNDPPLLEKVQKGMTTPLPDFVTHSELPVLLETCNVITNHVPLTFDGIYKTFKLLNEENLWILQPNSLFIHSSRGGVVDELTLLEVAKKKDLTLVVDVWENEPNVNLKLVEQTLLATPHIAGYSFDGKIRGTYAMAKAFESFSHIQPDYKTINRYLAEYSPTPKENFKDPLEIYKRLLVSRQIIEDSIKFKQIISLSPPRRKQYFDEFRKNYPVRREVL